MNFKTLAVQQIFTIIGAGCTGTFIAAMLAQLAKKMPEIAHHIRIMSDTFFGGSTLKVTQTHWSGTEYIADPESAFACIKGGIEFLAIWGDQGFQKLQELGILDHQGTEFTFSSTTLMQGTPTPETVRKNLAIFEAYYQALKTTFPASLSLPEHLYNEISQPVTGDPFAPITVKSSQRGTSIIRLGALLRHALEQEGVEILPEKVTEITQKGALFTINGRPTDTLINATNGEFMDILSLIRKGTPGTTLQAPPDIMRNHRYQLYLVATPPATMNPKEVDRVFGPKYSLSTANALDLTADPNTQFTGVMVDRISTLDNGSMLFALYAAGPKDREIAGGGSWAESGVPVEKTPAWPPTREEDIAQISAKIIASCEAQFPELKQLTNRKVLRLHDGYNINADTEQTRGRSDIRHFIPPVTHTEHPISITPWSTKYTQAAYTAKYTLHHYLQLLETNGLLSQDRKIELQAQLQTISLNPDQLTPSELTVAAATLGDHLQLGPLTPYMAAPKSGQALKTGH